MDSESISRLSLASKAFAACWLCQYRLPPWAATVNASTNPVVGISSLLVVFICIASFITIILVSNNQPVDSWKVSATILLSISASISNLALGTAFSVAVAATWWTSAVEGASLAQLHYIWERGRGRSFLKAFKESSTTRKVVLTASVVALAKASTGPLLQRATRQIIAPIPSTETLKLNLIQTLPNGWSGTISGTPASDIDGSAKAIKTTQEWWNNETITSLDTPGYYCDGICHGTVPGAGISHDCETTTQSLDLSTATGATVFSINTTMSHDSNGHPVLRLVTLYSSAVDSDCTATITIETCDIGAGVVDYPIIYDNSIISLNSNQLYDVTVVQPHYDPGDDPEAVQGDNAGILQGLKHFFGVYFFANSTVLNPSLYGGYSLITDAFVVIADSSSTCTLMWTSPTRYVLNSIQEFMFRAALNGATSNDVQSFTVQRSKDVQVFHSVYGYLAAASFVTMLALSFVLSMLPGRWWALGRYVSLSPLETARAFGVPLMGSAGRNMTAREILGDVGQIRVRYVDGVLMVYDKEDAAPVKEDKEEA